MSNGFDDEDYTVRMPVEFPDGIVEDLSTATAEVSVISHRTGATAATFPAEIVGNTVDGFAVETEFPRGSFAPGSFQVTAMVTLGSRRRVVADFVHTVVETAF